MQLTVFTVNNVRYIWLLEQLLGAADEIYVIMECVTNFPGKVEDRVRRSPVMESYFARVNDAELATFGKLHFIPDGMHYLPLKLGDLSLLDPEILGQALKSDVFLVAGSSYIRGSLADILIERGAYNIHMGVAPQYRGTDCNFWAIADGNPQYVGGTVHRLSRGLDNGAVIYHALPKAEDCDPFLLGMRAVKATYASFAARLRSRELFRIPPQVQDEALFIRYSRQAEFTDEVAAKYLEATPDPRSIGDALRRRDLTKFVHPFVA
jgi:hypothetical protein